MKINVEQDSSEIQAGWGVTLHSRQYIVEHVAEYKGAVALWMRAITKPDEIYLREVGADMVFTPPKAPDPREGGMP